MNVWKDAANMPNGHSSLRRRGYSTSLSVSFSLPSAMRNWPVLWAGCACCSNNCKRSTTWRGCAAWKGWRPHCTSGQFGKLLRTPSLTFCGRNRRPPRDPINACLSFGYALLGSVVENEVLRCGLDPWVGFFHQPHPGRASLTLDLMEEFRPFVDTLTLRLVNRQQLGPVDFERCCGEELAERLADEANGEHADADQLPGEGVYLAEAGRRIFLNQFFRRLRE